MSAPEHLDVASQSRAPEALANSLGARSVPAAMFATTEHFNLQTARAQTVSEANGRAAAGAVVGAGAFSLQERHHRRARDTYSPKLIDRAAILISPPRSADTA